MYRAATLAVVGATLLYRVFYGLNLPRHLKSSSEALEAARFKCVFYG
jgi:hypothetical protein